MARSSPGNTAQQDSGLPQELSEIKFDDYRDVASPHIAGNIFNPQVATTASSTPGGAAQPLQTATSPASTLFASISTGTPSNTHNPEAGGIADSGGPKPSQARGWIIVFVLLLLATLGVLAGAMRADIARLSRSQLQQEAQIGELKNQGGIVATVELLANKVEGMQSSQGVLGRDGVDGANGASGLAGSTGPAGATGSAGSQGVPGSNDCLAGVCVSRQAGTPGVQEIGSINIDGTIIAAALQGSGANLTALNASNLASGTVADARLTSNVTLQGNSFNGASQLVQTTAGGALPAISGANLTSLNASNISSGTLANARLTSSVTLQGNTFNGASQLVQLDGAGALPALSGAAITTLNASNISSGTLADARLSANVTVQGNTFNGASQLVQLTAGGILPVLNGSNLTNITGANVTGNISGNAGTATALAANPVDCGANNYATTIATNGDLTCASITDASLSANVTLQGNSFNGISQLVQTTAGGLLPALSGANLTSLNATNLASGTVTDARLSANVALLNGTGPQTFTGNNKFTGTVLAQNAADSTAAFQVQNAAGGSLVNVDSANANITLNGLNNGEIQAWATNANSLPVATREIQGAQANGYNYIVGGCDDTSCTNKFDTVYYSKLNSDGSTGTWTSTTVLPSVRGAAGITIANGYIYAIGGLNAGGTAQTTVYYAKLNVDGTVGSWGTTTALPGARFQVTTTVVKGYLYAVGGHNGSAAQSTVFYAKINADGSIGSWTTNANALPSVRRRHSMAIANGFMYVVGGDDGTTAASTVYYAQINSDGSIGSWTTNANALPVTRRRHGSVTANGHLYVIGGEGSTNSYFAPMNADGSTGAWSTSANTLPLQTRAAAVNIVNGYIYAIGGDNGSTTRTTVYYASTSRLKIGGSVDLVGLGGENLADTGNNGGSLTAADGTFVGDLQVRGYGTFGQGVSVGVSINVSGDALFKNQANSTTAFQIQNAAGTALLLADTTNSRITIGTSDTTGTLLVLDTKTDAGDPTGVNGGMYYNSNSGKFRCYENGAWVDCVGAIPHSETLGFQPGGTRTTTSTSYINWATDTSAVTITKHRADTDLIVEAHNTRFFGTATDVYYLAALVNGTDYQLIKSFPLANTQASGSGVQTISGLGAGNYTVQLRVKTTTGTYTYGDTNSNVGLKVTETY